MDFITIALIVSLAINFAAGVTYFLLDQRVVNLEGYIGRLERQYAATMVPQKTPKDYREGE